MRGVYAQAEGDYMIGRIEQARDTLLVHLGSFKGNERQNALRLIALSYLARFDIPQTEHYTALLLEQNPYYSPSAIDPAEFADIVNTMKAGMTATITTASNQAESLSEVPVPTTLITAEMIRNSGGRNLREVLAAYVPGMHLIDCNDDINIGMRGIYSTTQEKILIMLNGHRLNSYTTNAAAPDFSISLEKIKQIEVLRGPASSLYGGVALTAVVNIITHQGADIDGLQAKVSAGNYGQFKGDLIFGKRYFDVDILIWGSVYRNSGESRAVPDERRAESPFPMPIDDIRIGRVGDSPSYDFGLQLGWKGWQLLYDTHFSEVVSPYTATTLGMSYDHDRYCTHNGIGPSFTTYKNHAEVSYSHKMNNLSLKYAATFDKADLTQYQVISDAAMPTLGTVLGLPSTVDNIFRHYGGISRYLNGQEQNFGAQVKGGYAYDLGKDHKGALSFGAEFSHFQLIDMRYQIGYDFVQTFNENPVMREVGKGNENSADAYLQLKHQWRSLILNAGLRYDYKRRCDGENVHELSPRVALILLRPKWNVKLSYNKSFVDAPYIYRKANLMVKALKGTLQEDDTEEEEEKVLPERIHSFQLSFAGNDWVRGLNFELNGFYNRAHDLIMTQVMDYRNASKNQTVGAEFAASYRSPQTVSVPGKAAASSPRFTANFNLTWTRTFKSNLMSMEVGELLNSFLDTNIDGNNNTPAIMSNLVLAWQPTSRLKLHTHVLFEGKQTSHNTDLVALVRTYSGLNLVNQLFEEGKDDEAVMAYYEVFGYFQQIIMHKDMPARAILNLGGEYMLGPVTLGLNVHNLLNTRYNRSGMNSNVIPQQGRWFLASVGVRL
jgi:iron complex outermembrane receptor protein